MKGRLEDHRMLTGRGRYVSDWNLPGQAYGHFVRSDRSRHEAPVPPQCAIDVLSETLPDDAIVTCDAGENRIFMTHFYQTKSAEGFLQAAGAGLATRVSHAVWLAL